MEEVAKGLADTLDDELGAIFLVVHEFPFELSRLHLLKLSLLFFLLHLHMDVPTVTHF